MKPSRLKLSKHLLTLPLPAGSLLHLYAIVHSSAHYPQLTPSPNLYRQGLSGDDAALVVDLGSVANLLAPACHGREYDLKQGATCTKPHHVPPCLLTLTLYSRQVGWYARSKHHWGRRRRASSCRHPCRAHPKPPPSYWHSEEQVGGRQQRWQTHPGVHTHA